jgi:hypothetical protein
VYAVIILRFLTLSFVPPLLLQTDVMIVPSLSHYLLPEVFLVIVDLYWSLMVLVENDIPVELFALDYCILCDIYFNSLLSVTFGVATNSVSS